MMPHEPHTPPAGLLAHYQSKGLSPAAEKYYAMVEWFDQTCGVLDDYLVKHQLADNTVIPTLPTTAGMPKEKARWRDPSSPPTNWVSARRCLPAGRAQ